MKLEAGKFYKTRDGRRVGPMHNWDVHDMGTEHPWKVGCGDKCTADFDEYGDIWRNDGTSSYNCPDLVEECE